MKIEVFQPYVNFKIAGQVPRREKLEALMRGALSDCVAAAISGNDGQGVENAKALVMACQMLWNALADAKAEIERLKKAPAGEDRERASA